MKITDSYTKQEQLSVAAPAQGLESIYTQLSTQAPHCSFIKLIMNMDSGRWGGGGGASVAGQQVQAEKQLL